MNVDEFREADPLAKNERLRSNFVRQLVQSYDAPVQPHPAYLGPTPKRIVQFWDNLDQLPQDVKECMDSWRKLEQSGFEFHIFDERSAREFIKTHLGS